ncbi:MAG: hypothetical protein GWO40_02935, partial [Gammaproteobacteria bacterium]|nr:hypothetical protein [Gammaproteobacteria bacterium]NIX84526.1 hypothetical protein [Gammaproteobacteria bacterium]
YANYDDFISYPGKPARLLADKLGHGLAPTYRLYPCASEQWVFLALVSKRDQQRFVEALHDAKIQAPELADFDGDGDRLV